jgi:excisionase family DNA binding protein
MWEDSGASQKLRCSATWKAGRRLFHSGGLHVERRRVPHKGRGRNGNHEVDESTAKTYTRRVLGWYCPVNELTHPRGDSSRRRSNPVKIYTIKQAAEILQFSHRATIEHARRGKIPARKIGHEWRIEETALRDFMREQLQPGQPGEARG